MGELIPDRLRELFARPCSMLVAGALPSGPVATRSGGARLCDGDRLRVLLSGSSARALVEVARVNGPVAIVVADISDFTSFQVKGVIESVCAPSDQDHASCRRYVLDLISLSEKLYGMERARNIDGTVQAVITVRVDEVYRQSPGAGAGELLFARDERPVVATRAVELEVAADDEPSLSLRDIERSLDGMVPPGLVTVGPEHQPNVSYLSKLEIVDENTLAASRQFFKKTAQNLARDPRALALTMEVEQNFSYGVQLTHLRTETDGALFEQMRARIDVLASMMGMKDVFRLIGVDLFHVERVFELQGLVRRSE